MKNRHKYFRNQRYIQNLEKRYIDSRRSHIYFITKVVDPRYIKEEFPYIMKRLEWSHPNIEWFFEPQTGKDYYVYWAKPEVPYKIKEFYYKKSSWQKFNKSNANRNVRRKINMCEESLPRGGEYKKLSHPWWW